MLTHCRGSSPSMEPTGSNPFHLLKITTLVLWCSPPHHITWCPASWLSWGSLQRPGIDFASFISVRVISGDPFMEEWFRKWFFFSDLKKNRKKHEQFSFCVHDMKTENPKMAINYLFDVCFNWIYQFIIIICLWWFFSIWIFGIIKRHVLRFN